MKAQRLIPLAIVALSAGLVRADGVSMAVQVDHLQDRLDYVGRTSADGVGIIPDDQRLMGAWKNAQSIKDLYPWTDDDARVPLNFNLKNAGSEPLEVQSAYVEVTKSATDLQPFLSLRYDRAADVCESRLYSTDFSAMNFGWSNPVSVRVEMAFSRDYYATFDKTASLETKVVSFDLNSFSGFSWRFTIDRALTQLGANPEKLRAWSRHLEDQARGKKRGTYVSGMCSGNDVQCMRELQTSGVLGAVAGAAKVDRGQLVTTAVGRIVFDWRDVDGVTHTYKAPFTEGIDLGARDATCGAPEPHGPPGPLPPPDPPPRLLVPLELDRKDYRIDLKVSGQVAPGKSGTIKLMLTSPKSAQSRFKLVVVTNQGEIRSQQIDLLSFVARTKKLWGP